MMARQRIASEAGFGLPTAIIFLIIFSLIGLVGVSIARQEVRTEIRATSRQAAFYAAETGLAQGLQNWYRPAGLIPTDTSWQLAAGTLPGGSTYRVMASRLDDGNDVGATYSVRSVGRGGDGAVQSVGLLIGTRVVDNPISAALQVKDSATFAGTSEVNGNDRIPTTWTGSYCSALDANKPGVAMYDTMMYDKSGGAKLYGDPPKYEDTDTAGFFGFGDVSYGEMAAAADITLPDGTVVDGSNPRPSYNADGSCNTTDPMNWGDPLGVGQPCSSWFPIIHVAGDLHLKANNEGQGVLLVDGNLTAEGGVEFYGPVLVKGELIAEGGFTFFGGVRAGETELGSGNAEILYSACVLERVLSNTMAAKPQLLMERPWYRNR